MTQENNSKQILNNQTSGSNIDYKQKVLEVKGLKKYFFHGVGKNKLTIPAVDNISFDVYKREVFGLVGESGCGKTTAARTIIKLYNPTEGHVDLNEIRIGAGYMNFKNEIKKIKKETKEKIISLHKENYAKLNLKKELDKNLLLLNSDLAKLMKQKEAEIKEVKKAIYEEKDVKYRMHNQLVLAIDHVKYNFNIKVNEIKKSTLNSALTEYENEIKKSKTKFERKSIGLKESAALEKDEIKNRLARLHKEYTEELNDLKKLYDPLIEDAKATVLPKKEAKAQIKELKQQVKVDIAKIKAEYQEKMNNYQNLDINAIKEKVFEVEEKYGKLILEQKEKIKAAIAEHKEKVEAVPKLNLSSEEKQELKNKTAEILEESKEKISEIKAKIGEAKRVNKSKDALLASLKIQMIFQDPISSLNPRMTVKEIVGEGLTIQKHYSSEEINSRVSEALQLVGLSPEYGSRYPHEFSGGQRQRIGIARALIMNPDFIIADEPISALDVSIRAQVINLLSNLKEKLGLTIMFIAHDLSVVRFFCDRIAVMYYGKIVELATSEELFANPMHPYTKSLLSAIPQPDPDYEKGRKRIHYNPAQHDYRLNKPKLREIAPGHLVYVNDPEFEEMKKIYDKNNTKSEKVNV